MIVALAVLCVGIVPAQAQPAPTAAHALVITMDASGAARLADAQVVVLSEPLTQTTGTRAASMQGAMHDADPVTVLLLDNATGAVVYQTVTAAPNAVHGEFHVNLDTPGVLGLDGATIERFEAPLSRRVFPVRLPVIAGATRVVIQPSFGTRAVTEFDLSAPPAIEMRGSDNDPVHDIPAVALNISGYPTGPADNRVDVLILGDGYTQAQQSQFVNDAKTFANGMFSIDPYKTYKRAFNVKAVFAPSKQSGADRPPYNPACNDYDDSDGVSCCRDNNPSWASQVRKTRYNSTFCANQVARLLVAGDMERAFADATAAYPDWDEIWMIVNDTTYGGSGGIIAVASINSYGVQVQQHEVGHSLMRLADEYEGTYSGFTCSDSNLEDYDDCGPNITNVTNRNTLKWNYWVNASTPIPTAGPLADAGAAGLWRGGAYNSNLYRACYDCIMRTLGMPFGKVAAERLPIVLYTGGWEGAGSFFGMPSEGDGIDMIDSALPDSAFTVTILPGQSQDFTVNVVGPNSGIRVVWTLNDEVVKQGKVKPGADTFTLTPRVPMMGTLTAQVTDTNAILHTSNRALSTTSVSWLFFANGAPNPPTDLLSNGGFELADPAKDARAFDWKHTSIKGKRLCGDGLAESDSCYYKLQGKAGKAGTLKQTISGVALPDAGDLVVLTGKFHSIKLKGTFVARAQLVWSNGQKTKITLPKLVANSEGYVPVEAQAQLSTTEGRTMSKIIIMLKFSTPGGTVRVDSLELLNYPDFLAP